MQNFLFFALIVLGLMMVMIATGVNGNPTSSPSDATNKESDSHTDDSLKECNITGPCTPCDRTELHQSFCQSTQARQQITCTKGTTFIPCPNPEAEFSGLIYFQLAMTLIMILSCLFIQRRKADMLQRHMNKIYERIGR
eukprot:TRINITY_DN5973_c0_g1_i1.p1 TRINITY_DN5973_c0_g1~~TRINITY_DN5973_c0_g1_i1.p1  ORF type:complete len:147 (+),score=32.02 TRINITY_DN5973_c0_g1_i1:27-443(+)